MIVPQNPIKDGAPLSLRVGGLTLYSGDEIPPEFNALIPDSWQQRGQSAPKPQADLGVDK